VAVGLFITWLVAFTLFPALQKILRTPTQAERKTAAQWFQRFADWMPDLSYRFRWVTVPSAIILCIVGAIALFGFPGLLKPMKLLTDPIDYVNSNTAIYKDTIRVQKLMPGLSMAELWLQGKVGTLDQPEVIRGLDAFQQALEKEPMVGSAVGITSVLKMIRYVGGKGDRLPSDTGELESLTDDLQTLAAQEPLLSRFMDVKSMSQTHITLVTRITDYPAYLDLGKKIDAVWKDTLKSYPALGEFGSDGPKVVGLGRLQTKVAHNLVPTLTESLRSP
jgi:predicted RND superfamily exporter protein